MDKLTKAAQDHDKIFESMTFFKKSIEVFSNSEPSDFIEKFQKFIDEYIVEHFEFEENEVFPVIFKIGTKNEQQFIRELQAEHVGALDKISKLKDLVSSYGNQPIGIQIIEVIKCNREIIEMVLKHTRGEDKELFPLLKKYRINLNKLT